MDRHHTGLYYSLHLLFEKRLGWNLYCPIGGGWYKRGFWRYSRNPLVVKQYLEIPKNHIVHRWAQWSGEPPRQEDGVYLIPMLEGSHRYVHKAITFEKFLQLDFDFVIASVYNHEKPYHELIQKHKPEAVLIRQMGNPNEACDFSICKNILNSTTNPIPKDVNNVIYHQEFSLQDSRYETPTNHKTIKSFLNALPNTIDAPLWSEYEEAMPEFMWRMHGLIGRDGFLPERDKAKAMRESSFIWHLKSQGDGYGFVVHQAVACGRPLIVKKHYYAGQFAEPLLEDSVTCIDLDLGNTQENVEKIRFFCKPENHLEMCENAYRRFKENIDFDKEFLEIKKFLDRSV